MGRSADARVAATAASAVYAAAGRITQMVSQDGTSSYGYDSKSQLTSATHTYQTNESYSYDNNGNRTMTGYQTGADNRLTNDGTYTYQYDKEGNRTRRTKTATGEVTEYEWDYRHRLVKVTDKNSQGTTTQVVEYTYDVFDRRIAKEVDTSSPFDMADAAIERYVYDDIHTHLASLDGGNVVLDFVDPDGSGAQAMALAKRYLHGEAVDQILAQEDVSKALGDTQRTLWPLVDHLGTVRDLAKQDGTIAVHFKYDSYGNVTSGDTSKTRYLFTGRELDTATELQYNRARWYDAEVGRWISEDPLGFAAGDANVGRYVGNGPLDFLDPSGLLQDQDRPDDTLYPPEIRERLRRLRELAEKWVPFSTPGDSPVREDRYKAVVTIHLPPPWQAPADWLDPETRPPTFQDMLKDIAPKIAIEYGKQTDLYVDVMNMVEELEKWATEHPILAAGAVAGIAVGTVAAAPGVVDEMNRLLPKLELPAIEKFSTPTLHIPLEFIRPGVQFQLKATWEPRPVNDKFKNDKYRVDFEIIWPY